MTARFVKASLVVRLDDFATGRPVWPGDRSLRVRGADGFCVPAAKEDGHFVFTGTRPALVAVASEFYAGITLRVSEGEGFLRAALLARHVARGRVYELDGGAHIGFRGERGGYALCAETRAGGRDISLRKEDYADLSGLMHILSAPDGTETPVFLNAGGGRGKYVLSEPAVRDFPARSRVTPLFRIGEGAARVPIPENARLLYILRGGMTEKIEL
ncbi:MAG: hypothetical protein LBR85_00465 [Oscillospiraceae bacterium]|jgi:hypothetical protein|nr:hypothetical protein [Oscillospiraceae bacterium]